MSPIKVLIIGSGLGGLSLAQSLLKASIPFEIYERDATPFARAQGYRLHLDSDAINTIREVLPDDLIRLFDHTSHWTESYTDIMDLKSFKVVKRILTKDEHGSPDPRIKETKAGHAKFEKFESTDDDEVTAYFADGSNATGTVLVGADGIHSAVRRQRAPACVTMDAGITAIYGRLPLEAVREAGLNEVLQDIFVIGADERKAFLGLGSVIFPTEPSEAAKNICPETRLPARDSYCVCIVGGRHELFPENTSTATSQELQEIAARTLGDKVATLVRTTAADSFFAVRMRSSVPGALSTHHSVTLLGDAIHAMTPSLGRGANLAMRHGALLGRHLRRVAEDKGSLMDELAAYEDAMTRYGFAVVQDAARWVSGGWIRLLFPNRSADKPRTQLCGTHILSCLLEKSQFRFCEIPSRNASIASKSPTHLKSVACY